jgi:hypothetical protein
VTCASGNKVNVTQDGCEAIVCNDDTPKTDTDCWTLVEGCAVPENYRWFIASTLCGNHTTTNSYLYNGHGTSTGSCSQSAGNSYDAASIGVLPNVWTRCPLETEPSPGFPPNFDHNYIVEKLAYDYYHYPSDRDKWKIKVNNSSLKYGCGYIRNTSANNSLQYCYCNNDNTYNKAWDW